MSVFDFISLLAHVGHEIKVVTYSDDNGDPVNVAIECFDCNEVLLSYDKYCDFHDDDDD